MPPVGVGLSSGSELMHTWLTHIARSLVTDKTRIAASILDLYRFSLIFLRISSAIHNWEVNTPYYFRSPQSTSPLISCLFRSQPKASLTPCQSLSLFSGFEIKALFIINSFSTRFQLILYYSVFYSLLNRLSVQFSQVSLKPFQTKNMF